MGNGMRNRQVLVMCVMVLALCLTSSSCETLRKKFTRQKKKGQSENSDFIPVLEPQEYPAPQYNAEGVYQDHYALIKVWFKDLMSGVNEREDSDNKVRYALKQINEHLDAMLKLLDPSKHVKIEKARALLQSYSKALEQHRAARNRSGLQSDLRQFDRVLRRDLRVEVIKKDLIKIEPPH